MYTKFLPEIPKGRDSLKDQVIDEIIKIYLKVMERDNVE